MLVCTWQLLAMLALATGPGPVRGVGAASRLRLGMTGERIERMLGPTIGIARGLGFVDFYEEDGLCIGYDSNRRVVWAEFIRRVRYDDGYRFETIWRFLKPGKDAFDFSP